MSLLYIYSLLAKGGKLDTEDSAVAAPDVWCWVVIFSGDFVFGCVFLVCVSGAFLLF